MKCNIFSPNMPRVALRLFTADEAQDGSIADDDLLVVEVIDMLHT
jgi:hypothetical protein